MSAVSGSLSNAVTAQQNADAARIADLTFKAPLPTATPEGETVPVPQPGLSGQALVSNGNGSTRWQTLPASTVTAVTVTPALQAGAKVADVVIATDGGTSVTKALYAPASAPNPQALSITETGKATVTYDGSAAVTLNIDDIKANAVTAVQAQIESLDLATSATPNALRLNPNGTYLDFDGSSEISVIVEDTRVYLPASGWTEYGAHTEVYYQETS